MALGNFNGFPKGETMTSARKFPKLRDDGSFSVTAVFRCRDDQVDIVPSIADWLQKWLCEHDPWVFRWHGGDGVRIETCYFGESFHGTPSVAMSQDGQLVVVFEARSLTLHWKDWLVRITKEMAAEFESVEGLIRSY